MAQFSDFMRRFQNIEFPKLELPKNYTLADTFYDRLQHHIKALEEKLKEDEQLLLYNYVTLSEPILVTDIGFHNPYLIVFYGKDSNDNECFVLTHMSSVQLVLKVVKIKSPAERRLIGFQKQ